VLPRVPRPQTSAFLRGSSGAATCHTAPGGLWTTGMKKGIAALGTQLGSCVSKARSCVTEAPANVHAATVHPHSASLAQLTTPEYGYSGDIT
jgi:hypothetical protein